MKNRICFLDALRFFAAINVIIAHCLIVGVGSFKENSSAIFSLNNPFIYWLFYSGGVGVCVFFLISGYIMPFLLERTRSFRDFMINRIFRLMPLFLLFVAIESIYFDRSVSIGRLILPVAVFFEKGGRGLQSGIDWTLRIEFLFYLIIGVIFFLRKFNERNVLAIQIILFALALIAPTELQRAFSYVVFILVGTMLFLRERTGHNFSLTISILLAIGIWLHIDGRDFPNYFGIIGMVIFFGAYGLRKKIRDCKTVKNLGDTTYASYLCHFVCFPIFAKLVGGVAAVGLIFVSAWLLHATLERYGVRLGKKIIGER